MTDAAGFGCGLGIGVVLAASPNGVKMWAVVGR